MLPAKGSAYRHSTLSTLHPNSTLQPSVTGRTEAYVRLKRTQQRHKTFSSLSHKRNGEVFL